MKTHSDTGSSCCEMCLTWLDALFFSVSAARLLVVPGSFLDRSLGEAVAGEEVLVSSSLSGSGGRARVQEPAQARKGCARK